MLALRTAFALVVTGLVVWLLLAGMPLGALALALVAVALRHAAESGRLAGVANRLPRL